MIPSAIIVPTIYGQMIVNRHDINQTNHLFKTGLAHGHREIVMLAELLEQQGRTGIVLDIGANFGCYALGLAQVLEGHGVVHAFEAQRQLCNMMAGSVAINDLNNVYCHNVAVGAEAGRIEVPQFDYSQANNFGSIEFGPEQTEKLPQERQNDPERIEYVEMRSIDSYDFKRVALMKIDVEGMELAVLQGAVQTVRQSRPILYVEHLKSDTDALKAYFAEHKYEVHDNRIDYLCIPQEQAARIIVGVEKK